MTTPTGANLYTQGFGSRPESVEIPTYQTRAPATTDVLWPVGKRWIDQSANAEYTLSSMSTSNGVVSATWITLGGGSSAVATETGDTGTAVPSGGNIKHAGTANQISTSASGATITYSLIGPYTPATFTAHGVLVGEGTSSIAALAVGTNGQVLTGATGADPVFSALGTNSGLTAHGVLLGEGNSAIAATAVGATGETLMGSTGADPGWTGSPSFSGSVTAGTTITATLGDITATNGNLNLNTTGNKINISAAASATDSVGTATLNGSGTVTVATTAVKTNSLIFVTINTPTNPGFLSVPSASIVDSTQFVINSSSGTDASTVNYWIIN